MLKCEEWCHQNCKTQHSSGGFFLTSCLKSNKYTLKHKTLNPPASSFVVCVWQIWLNPWADWTWCLLSAVSERAKVLEEASEKWCDPFKTPGCKSVKSKLIVCEESCAERQWLMFGKSFLTNEQFSSKPRRIWWRVFFHSSLYVWVCW